MTRDGGLLASAQLPPFTLEEIEPDRLTLAVLRQVIACGMGREGLGEEWWCTR